VTVVEDGTQESGASSSDGGGGSAMSQAAVHPVFTTDYSSIGRPNLPSDSYSTAQPHRLAFSYRPPVPITTAECAINFGDYFANKTLDLKTTSEKRI
jgi:hypothetical protein